MSVNYFENSGGYELYNEVEKGDSFGMELNRNFLTIYYKKSNLDEYQIIFRAYIPSKKRNWFMRFLESICIRIFNWKYFERMKNEQ